MGDSSRAHRIGIASIDDTCNGCKACVDSCMMDVIYFDELEQRAFPKYPDDCQACFLCVRDCPVGSIQIAAVD